MPQFALLLRDDPQVFAGLSPEEAQKTIEKYRNWRLAPENRIVGGNKLKDHEGHVLRKNGSKPSVTDGPFVEAKEVMAGFFLIEAESYAEAVERAKTCPHMQFGSIEVRQIDRV